MKISIQAKFEGEPGAMALTQVDYPAMPREGEGLYLHEDWAALPVHNLYHDMVEGCPIVVVLLPRAEAEQLCADLKAAKDAPGDAPKDARPAPKCWYVEQVNGGNVNVLEYPCEQEPLKGKRFCLEHAEYEVD